MDCSQLIIVVTASWNAHQGELYLFERENVSWKLVEHTIPVVVGESGMAWGLGLHPTVQGNQKREGDLKSPAGIFSLGPAFGHQMPALKVDYLPLKRSLEAIDDPRSRYYNQIVDTTDILDPDWQSSEKMGEIALYDLGLVIQHNLPHPHAGAGSAIFMHIWRDQESGTAGCTAMNRNHLLRLLEWLDRDKNPRLVQLPREVYQEVHEAWCLPEAIQVKSML